MWPRGPNLFASASALAILVAGTVVGGCSIMGRDKPETTAATSPPASGSQIDIRHYLGPNYCPDLRIPLGSEVDRLYEKGHKDDPDYVVWQASIGKTARECLYDAQGGLTLRVGVSGRVISGPKGETGPVTVPLKIAVVKFQESVLAAQTYDVAVTIPPSGSAVFTEVKDILVPAPGQNRDYVVYAGFNVGDWDPMHPDAVAAPPVVATQEPLPDQTFDEPSASPPPPPPPPPTPKELPTPKGLIPGL